MSIGNQGNSGPVSVERVPLARLKPAEWNPRLIRDSRFKDLCRSIEADPEFLWRRPILARSNGEIFAGNMRYRAVQHLGWESVPAIVEDVPDKLAKERAIRDNNAWGEWQEQDLSELLAELQIQESDLEALGFEPWKLNQLIGDGSDDPRAEWQGMPEFEHEDQTDDAAFTIRVFLKDADDLAALSQLLGKDLAGKKFVWFGKQPQGKTCDVYDEAPA